MRFAHLAIAIYLHQIHQIFLGDTLYVRENIMHINFKKYRNGMKNFEKVLGDLDYFMDFYAI
jgi:hypothetical protein